MPEQEILKGKWKRNGKKMKWNETKQEKRKKAKQGKARQGKDDDKRSAWSRDSYL